MDHPCYTLYSVDSPFPQNFHSSSGISNRKGYEVPLAVFHCAKAEGNEYSSQQDMTWEICAHR